MLIYARLIKAWATAWCFSMLFCLSILPPLYAGGGPEKTLLVVNEDAWDSLSLANEYVQLRKIPPSNVVHLRDLPGLDTIAVEDFRKTILRPVLDAIERRKLEDQIDTIQYGPGIPTAIWCKPEYPRSDMPVHLRDLASITSMTYQYEHVLSGNAREYSDLDNNCYARRPLSWLNDRSWTREETKLLREMQKLDWQRVKYRKYYKRDQKAPSHEEEKSIVRECLHRAEHLLINHPTDASLHYHRACYLCRLDRPNEALETLALILEDGKWEDYHKVEEDEDLKPLLDQDEFENIIEAMKSAKFEMQPSIAFSHRTFWGPKGEKQLKGEGRRYYLSTVLSYTSGAALSFEQAVKQLHRSVAADGCKPEGTIYFVRNKDVRSTTREYAFPATVAKLKELGVEAKVVEGILPENRNDVAGAVIGVHHFDWIKSGSTILPGAILENLTSIGGQVWRRGQTPCSDFLRHGAAGSGGTVSEPWALQKKFPFPWMQVRYAEGYSLAEVFYQSLCSTYQYLVVGDALCQPWARIPDFALENSPKALQKIEGTLFLKPSVTADSPCAVESYEYFLEGRAIGTERPGVSFRLNSADYCDGYHLLRVSAISAEATRTRASILLPLTFRNHGKEEVAAHCNHKQIHFGESFRVHLHCANADEMTLKHSGRLVANSGRGQEDVILESSRLGMGQVLLHPFARTKQGLNICGTPVEIEILPPSSLSPLDPIVDLKDGFVLKQSDRDPVVVQTQTVVKSSQKEKEKNRHYYDGSSKVEDWLKDAGLKPGRPFELTAYFLASEDGIYQFQARSNLRLGFEIDGKAFELLGGTMWRSFPISLLTGHHHLKIAASGAESPVLELRFGRTGVTALDGKRFQHSDKMLTNRVTSSTALPPLTGISHWD